MKEVTRGIRREPEREREGESGGGNALMSE
jgi:hypothetical protein